MNGRTHPSAADATTAVPAITAHHLAAAFQDRTVWRNLDLEVEPGEFVAILGPNGSGKSTLIKILVGQLSPTAGTVRIFGEDPRRARSTIGYLPQRRHFDASTRVRGVDVVRLGFDGHRLGIPLPWGRGAREARRAVAAVVERVGAAEYAHHPIGRLSGGEQQRLLIAQALVRRPRLLLLDEPLDSLDLPNQIAVAGLLKDLCTVDGVTVVMVAHDVNPILSYLDKVVYLAAGTGVSGRPEEVITSERLTALFGAPIDVLRASDGRLVVVGEPEAPAFHADRHAR